MTNKLFLTPFSADGTRVDVPDALQPDGLVSYTQGFGPDYERPLGLDPQAKNILRANHNALYYAITVALREMQSGLGAAQFNPAMAAAIGGYPQGAVLPIAGNQAGYWISKAANNNTDPATGQGWLPVMAVGISNVALSNVDVTLTPAQAAKPTISLTGVLTANVAVIVPSGWVYAWNVLNKTTGAFTVTVKTAAGAGVTIKQGGSSLLSSYGVDVSDTLTDFESIAITGTSTCPTAAPGTNSLQLANTAFVDAVRAVLLAAIGLKANNDSPTLTGVPKAPTAALGTDTDQIATMAAIQDAIIAADFPAGAALPFAMTTAPAGWIKANGATISRVTFARLFAAIGTTFGAGDGSTTFKLPDLRGEFIRGFTDGSGVDAGRVFGSLQLSSNLSHSHGASASNYAHTHTFSATTSSDGSHTHPMSGAQGSGNNAYVAFQDLVEAVVNTGAAGVHNHTLGGTTSSDTHSHTVTVAADGGAESRPRNVALLMCIKY